MYVSFEARVSIARRAGELTIRSVIGRYEDDVLISCDVGAVVEVLSGSALAILAAVDPEHDRLVLGRSCRCVDVQVEAVLALNWSRCAVEEGYGEVAS